MKGIMIIIALALATLTIGSCNGDKKTDAAKKEMKVDMSGPEYTSKYICPMYCKGSGSHEMGTCPVCKMDYELNENFKEDANHDGHNHDGHNHDGHNHDGHNHDGHNHDGHNHDGHNH